MKEISSITSKNKESLVKFVEEYYDVKDKSDWGPGPWENEVDKAVWVDETTGLDCMINRGPMGALCGYVGVGPDHPLYGKDYDDWGAEVHGGLTYANACSESDDPSDGICHVPQAGRPSDVWWFGFDCAHAFDLVPSMIASNRRFYEKAVAENDHEGMRLWDGHLDRDQTYRSVRYVESEVRSLAAQLADRACG